MIEISVETDGPIVEGERQARELIRKGLLGVVRKVALVGEGYVKDQMYPGHGVLTGHLRRSTWGGIVSEAKPRAIVNWSGGRGRREVVYGQFVDRRYGIMRRATRRLGRLNLDKIVEDELVNAMRGT